MKTGRWENSFVHSKIGYVRSQVEPLARNAPRFQFSPASSQQNYRKITLLLAKNEDLLLAVVSHKTVAIR